MKSQRCLHFSKRWRDDIDIVEDNGTEVAFKNCASFNKCITKIDGTTIDGTEDLDLVISVYNLLEYSLNLSNTTRSLCLLSKDRANKFNASIAVIFLSLSCVKLNW